MGIFDKIKKAFDKGGVGVDIDCPETFRWSDGSLPVAVQLTNSSDEERVITHLTLSLGEDTLLADRDEDDSPSERAREKRRLEESATTFEHREPITLAPGEVRALEIDLPLSLSDALDTVGAGDAAPGWLQTASKVLDAANEIRSDAEWYRLKVRPHVDGFSAAEVESRRVRNLRLGESQVGLWTHRFS